MATFAVEVVETSVAEVVVKRWVEDFAAANGLSVMPFPKGSGNFEKAAELADVVVGAAVNGKQLRLQKLPHQRLWITCR